MTIQKYKCPLSWFYDLFHTLINSMHGNFTHHVELIYMTSTCIWWVTHIVS